jgi:RNA polymerase sigma-70 factor (ECF subfamily)
MTDGPRAPHSEPPDFGAAALEHLPRLMGVARRLCRTAAEAEDLVQDTYVKALRAQGQYQPGTNLRAWLLKILKNTFINRYRRGGIERSLLQGPDADPLADGWVGATTMRALRDPESQALRAVLEEEIETALRALPEDFRMVVLFADVEDLSYREIAEVLDCPIGTVMSRLHRGRRLLKRSLYEQAVAFGIVAPATRDATEEPVHLDDYRKKEGKAR